jgi:hypothetical protein
MISQTTENKMNAPARTHKTAANKTVSNIIYTINEGTYKGWIKSSGNTSIVLK